MKLIYKEDYKSITKFNDFELENFTVLTGVNGSGKSHLLEAIRDKKVIIDNLEDSHIVLFNFETFRLENEQSYNTSQLMELGLNPTMWLDDAMFAFQNIMNAYPHIDIIIQIAKEKDKSLISLVSEDFNLNDSELGGIGMEILNEYNQFKQEYNNFLENLKLNNINTYILLNNIGIDKFVNNLYTDELKNMISPFILKNGFLPVQLGKIFWDYYDKYERNSFNKYKKKEFLSEENFIKNHGKKPWDIVNNVLKKFKKLNYIVNSPEEEDLDFITDSFQLKLKNIKNGAEVDFQDLSSGEKILMALVASIYKAYSDNTFSDINILLLDEIDASLHPSMIENLLDVIKDIFLENGMKVIMVTHSPSTIALSPESSIFVMHKEGEYRIEKSSKEKALDILTEGFVSLTNNQTRIGISYNISKTDLPILFTEGITDKIILETAWKKLYEGKEMPFYIQDAFDALFLANLLKRGSEGSGIFKIYEDKLFIALFDFDGEGYNQWNGLSQFSEKIEENPRLCLTKKHSQENAYALLLPVSEEVKDNVIKKDNETYKSESSLQIELLFYQVEQLSSFFRNQDMPGGGKIIEFFGKKIKFTEQIKNLDKEDFKNFLPLLEKIENLLST